MKHLIFLIPDLKETCDVAKELEQAGVKDQDLHVYSATPDILRQFKINRLSIFHMVHMPMVVGRALVFGILFSLLIYLWFMFSSVHVNFLGDAAIIGFGLGFGFWVSGMIGLQTLKEFQSKYDSYVREGHYLMMVDALDKREKELINLILSQHGDVHYSDETSLQLIKH